MFVIRLALLLLGISILSGCSTTGINGEAVPKDPLHNGYGAFGLCSPDLAVGLLHDDCVRQVWIQKVDGKTSPYTTIAYLLPGEHDVEMYVACDQSNPNCGYPQHWRIEIHAGYFYQLTQYRKTVVWENNSSDPIHGWTVKRIDH